MKKLFLKFKFKWWSWEIDTLRVLPFIFLVLASLPILPHEKKDGKLITVMGYEAVESNFYTLHLNDEILDFVGMDLPDFPSQKKYLLDEGYSKEKANCVLMRDLFLNNHFYNNEMQNFLYEWTTSPVPAIWLARIFLKDHIGRDALTMESYETFEILIKKCKQFGNIVPPPGYLNNEFNYQIKNNY